MVGQGLARGTSSRHSRSTATTYQYTGSTGSMAYQDTQLTRQQSQAVGTNKVLRNTYGLLAMTLLFSAVTAGAAMAMGVERLNIFVFFIGAYGLMFLVHKTANSAMGLLATFAFTGFMGFTLGPILNAYLALPNGAALVMNALAMTGLTFIRLSAAALVSKQDFSFLGNFLMAGEGQAGHGQGVHHQGRPVGQRQVGVEDRPEGEAHETGEGEGGQQPHGRVGGLVHQEHQAVGADEEHEDIEPLDAHGHGGTGGDRREQQRHGEQAIGVAQHLVGADRLALLASKLGVLVCHGSSAPCVLVGRGR